MSDLYSEDDDRLAEEDADALQMIRQAQAEPRHAESTAVLKLPPALARVIGTESEDELMAVARFLDARNRKRLTLVFHTPIGDVKCPVNWSSTEPTQLSQCRHLLLILVRSSDSMFIPLPGSELEISFNEHRDQPRLKVICLAPPMQLYPGVGIDLLCFMPQSDLMEKQGVLREGAPSAVSGRPSNDVDENGEPVVHGEKSASAVLPPSGSDGRELDFDKPREG